jgi:SAM-dependent methyltransferase
MARIRPLFIANQLKNTILDAVDYVQGKRDPLIPPRRLSFVFGGDFKSIGKEFLGYFQLFGMQPNDRVLDVGCGIGRMALALTGYIRSGSYEGFDIIGSAIDWCKESITPAHPQFRFTHADIFNKSYNSGGKVQPSNFTFPYPDKSFDFAFLTSVFTHMFPKDIAHYMSELSRVIKPGGRCLITWFLVNNESARLVDSGKSRLPMTHICPGYCTINRKTPEYAVGIPEIDAIEFYIRNGFSTEPIHYGTWCGRQGMSFQDIIVATRNRE